MEPDGPALVLSYAISGVPTVAANELWPSVFTPSGLRVTKTRELYKILSEIPSSSKT